MEHHRRWRKLCPVVRLCTLSGYDEVLKRIFEANPAISGAVLRAFLLNGYQVNVVASELDQWINVARLYYADHLLAYDDWLRGCYNVQPTMDASHFSGLLADAGVDCTAMAMQCWMLLQPPLLNVKLSNYSAFIAGWEMDAYDDFLRGCCVAMPGASAIRLRIALMQTMGVKCRLAHMVHWMRSNPRLCKVAIQKKRKRPKVKKTLEGVKRGRSMAWSYSRGGLR